MTAGAQWGRRPSSSLGPGCTDPTTTPLADPSGGQGKGGWA